MSKTNPQQVIAQAFELHKIGRLPEAISLYQQALRAAPGHLGALNLMGVALMQSGRLKEAAETIEKAINAAPEQADSHFNLATVLQGLERYDEAIRHFEKAIALKPNDPQSHNNLGAVLNAVGKNEQSLAHLDKAVSLAPRYPDPYYNRGNSLVGLKRYEEAVESYRRAAALKQDPDIQINLGNALRELDRRNEALGAYETAIAMQPNRADAYMNAGKMLLAHDLFASATPYLEKAVAITPDNSEPYFHLARCLHATNRYEEGERTMQKGLLLEPGNSDAEVALATFLQELNRHEEAIPHFERALSLKADNTQAMVGLSHSFDALEQSERGLDYLERAISIDPQLIRAEWNRSIINLRLGNFHEGWSGFQHRFAEQLEMAIEREYTAPRWDGKNLDGTLAVWGEQGIGDHIIYSSMIPDALERVKKVRIEVEPRLIPLFSRSFPSAEVTSAENKSGPADAHVPIGGLGQFFRRDWDSFPRQSYLTADTAVAQSLHTRLHADGRKVIGLSWQSANPKMGMHKTAKLVDFRSLLQLPGLRFVDLQYGETTLERERIRQEFNVEVERLPDVDNKQDIDKLAALIAACDAVVTVSNTTAHIAGALGKPVWVLVPHAQGRLWYWFKERTDSPWYPEARIRRQKNGQSWADLIASVEPEVTAYLRTGAAKF